MNNYYNFSSDWLCYLRAYIHDTYNKLLMWAGAEGDSSKTTTPDIVEEQQVTQNWPIRVVMGL